jgi:hypothetical protein
MKTSNLMLLIGMAFAMCGCEDSGEAWDAKAPNKDDWFYLVASDVRVQEPGPDAGIPDLGLILTNPRIAKFGSLGDFTNRPVVVAMLSNFRSMLVTGAVGRAVLPEYRGKVLPTIVDRKIEIHFLSRIDGRWYSTNVLRTRVVSVTYPP